MVSDIIESLKFITRIEKTEDEIPCSYVPDSHLMHHMMDYENHPIFRVDIGPNLLSLLCSSLDD